MKFAPKPENDFAEFIRAYYDECRSRFDGIEAIAGKWMLRDLIPGMSDFDTRFICRDGMTADDWCDMSTAVGEAHLFLCKKYACWARNLEHLPGINLTWDELSSEQSYYPEYRQWTFYRTENTARLDKALGVLESRSWDTKDEYFHLKKFCLFFGRYDRQIDPGCNLFPHENKYPLHSRIMHYFTPPVHSAMCILERRNIVGKFDVLELAERHFPELQCWKMINEILHANYEAPQWYEESQLSELEDALEAALEHIAGALREIITLVQPEVGTNIAAWKKSLQSAPIDPAMVIFDNAKFSRLMKGRLQFYAHCPDHFDSVWCIENELGRLGNNFFRVPFCMYWKIKTGESVDDPVEILDKLRGDPLTDVEIEATKEFARLTPGRWEKGKEKELAVAIADVFDDFFKALHKISSQAALVQKQEEY